MIEKQESVFQSFHPVVAGWFRKNYDQPTPPQAQGWPLIATGNNVLLLAPTGSGKTLAAFLKCLDWLYYEADSGRPIDNGVKVLYISPLKALNNDIHRNLEQPLQGIEATAREMGLALPKLATAVRTGDTPGKERQRMLRRPPQILITTPESLFLMLSSQARNILKTVRFVIVDEIHTLYPTKRGAHLALSLERLEHLTGGGGLQRIGLSATMRPLEAVAAYLGGYAWDFASHDYQARPVAVVDTGQRKTLDLKILLPLPDLRELPEKSIWPPIYRQLWELIQQHRTTLVFVNNRRLAERITVNLNQLAGKEIARTHHGSVSKEMRLQAETLLKEGEIPCIVATASLELGIDIGHIDLVVQVETPKGVARGLQRVGRAGHVVGMPSKGRLIPKTRGDLLECAALIREMKAGRVEPTKAVLNCLDILAQQLVALTAEGTWQAEAAFRVIRSAYNFQTLSYSDFENVLKMLAGNFETEAFVDLRPRLYWDRTTGELKPDPYGKRLIYSSGGTIPDRGYYGVYLGNGGVRLGELDEEFVYERRINERFVLGTSVWKIEEIRQDRVIVSPSRKSGEAMVPFWKAEQPGRPFELGKRLGVFLAELEARLDNPEIRQWLADECCLEPESSDNLIQYVAAQKAAVGALPTDRRLIVEEFPDVAGEWRVLIHSTFGWRVHLTLGLLIKEQWEREYLTKVEVISEDDGIMFHLPGGVRPPGIDWSGLAGESLREKVAALIAETPLFGATFRQAAQISLVMPRTGYGRKRTPFWLSRLKAGNLLHTVSHYPDFPLVIETYRAILQDYLEIEALRELLQNIRQGQIVVQRCQHQTPSPFAGSHLFNFVGNFMYESETPKTEYRKQLFGMGKENLQAIVGEAGFRDQLDPTVVAAVERQARGVDLLQGTLSIAAVQAWLERLGDVTDVEVVEWFGDNASKVKELLQLLEAQGKAGRWSAPGRPTLVVAGLELPFFAQLAPEHSAGAQARRRIIRRFVRTRGIVQTQEIEARYSFTEPEVHAELAVLAAEGLVLAGAFRPGGEGDEWCEVNLFTEMQRRSLAASRRAVEAVSPHQFAAFLIEWQGMKRQQTGLDGLAGVLEQLNGVWLTAEAWEQSILPGRLADYRGSCLDQLIAGGAVCWRARGNSRSFRICFETVNTERPMDFPDLPAKTGASLPDLPQKAVLSSGALKVYELLGRQGALAFPRILQLTKLSTVVVWEALEELVLNELITNDSFGPIRYLLQTGPEERVGARGVIQPATLAGWGRWSALSPLTVTTGDLSFRLLKRYGLVCREIAQAEGLSWSELFSVLDFWETLGRVKRGYFVSGLSGIQFALAEAVERITESAAIQGDNYRMVGWIDPANPVKILPEWPGEDDLVKPGGEYLVFEGGRPVLVVYGNRKIRVKTLPGLETDRFVRAMAAFLKTFCPAYSDERLDLTHINGMAVLDAPWVENLIELGFEKGYQKLTCWASRRNVAGRKS